MKKNLETGPIPFAQQWLSLRQGQTVGCSCSLRTESHKVHGLVHRILSYPPFPCYCAPVTHSVPWLLCSKCVPPHGPGNLHGLMSFPTLLSLQSWDSQMRAWLYHTCYSLHGRLRVTGRRSGSRRSIQALPVVLHLAWHVGMDHFGSAILSGMRVSSFMKRDG